MKHRGRWPQRDYQEVTGQPINVSFRLTGAQKAWVDDAAETSGRSLAQEFSAMAQRAIAADTDLLNSHDLTFGPANVAFMLLTGLVLAEVERGAAYQWGEPSETDAVAAATLSEMLSILFDIDIAVALPATIQQTQAGLRPLFEIGEFLAGDRPKPARFVDQRIIDRLGPELCQRVVAWYRKVTAQTPPERTVQPPQFATQDIIDRGHKLIHQLAAEKFPRRRAALRDLLGIYARTPGLPDNICREFASAGQEPISVEELIEAGRGIVRQLKAAQSVEQREHHRERLLAMARLTLLPRDIRAEFQRAAESAVVWLPASSPPAGMLPAEWRPRHVLLFDACWLLATARLGHPEPDEKQIAEAFVAADLFEDADMGDVPRDADSVLRYRDWIEQERAKAWAAVPSEPQAEATEAPSPSPPSAKRGRSRRPLA